jgi:hypothetical protein
MYSDRPVFYCYPTLRRSFKDAKIGPVFDDRASTWWQTWHHGVTASIAIRSTMGRWNMMDYRVPEGGDSDISVAEPHITSDYGVACKVERLSSPRVSQSLREVSDTARAGIVLDDICNDFRRNKRERRQQPDVPLDFPLALCDFGE